MLITNSANGLYILYWFVQLNCEAGKYTVKENKKGCPGIAIYVKQNDCHGKIPFKQDPSSK